MAPAFAPLRHCGPSSTSNGFASRRVYHGYLAAVSIPGTTFPELRSRPGLLHHDRAGHVVVQIAEIIVGARRIKGVGKALARLDEVGAIRLEVIGHDVVGVVGGPRLLIVRP